jgi:transcriptional regulator with XRE-family HTH domain
MRRVVRRIAGESATVDGREPVDVRLGQLMNERRKQIGLSRQGLAAQLDMTKADIRKYEKGETPFGADMLVVLHIALKVKIQFFTDQVTNLVRSRGVASNGKN